MHHSAHGQQALYNVTSNEARSASHAHHQAGAHLQLGGGQWWDQARWPAPIKRLIIVLSCILWWYGSRRPNCCMRHVAVVIKRRFDYHLRLNSPSTQREGWGMRTGAGNISQASMVVNYARTHQAPAALSISMYVGNGEASTVVGFTLWLHWRMRHPIFRKYRALEPHYSGRSLPAA